MKRIFVISAEKYWNKTRYYVVKEGKDKGKIVIITPHRKRIKL